MHLVWKILYECFKYIPMKTRKKGYKFLYMPVIHGCIYLDCCCFVYILPWLVFLLADIVIFSMKRHNRIIHQDNFWGIYPKAWKMETLVEYINAFNELLTNFLNLQKRNCRSTLHENICIYIHVLIFYYYKYINFD